MPVQNNQALTEWRILPTTQNLSPDARYPSVIQLEENAVYDDKSILAGVRVTAVHLSLGRSATVVFRQLL